MVALVLFIALAGIGLAISILHFRQLSEREFSATHVSTQNIRFNAALNNMSQGLCMFDGSKRLVVCNERYAHLYALPPELLAPGTSHEAIIKHRISSGILKVEKSADAVGEKLAALNKHSTDAVSSRVDKLTDGRLIKVVRAPMPDGGWVATHEDVTEQAHRDSIDSAIASSASALKACSPPSGSAPLR
jgi:PAS domain-containing protein